MKTIKMELSSQSINSLIKRLENFQKDIKQVDKKVVNELCNLGLQEIQQNYASTPYKDGNEDVGFFITGSDANKKVGASGTQVLYNEFGTGTEGANIPHPQKGEFGLNNYNSGRTIRTNNKEKSNATNNGIPVGGLYWTYKVNGVKKYTQGIPAGMQVYKAAKTIEKQKTKIIKKVVGDVLSKL